MSRNKEANKKENNTLFFCTKQSLQKNRAMISAGATEDSGTQLGRLRSIQRRWCDGPHHPIKSKPGRDESDGGE
jgi:hypothetical protein